RRRVRSRRPGAERSPARPRRGARRAARRPSRASRKPTDHPFARGSSRVLPIGRSEWPGRAMADAEPVVYSWAMESEREQSSKGGAPVAAMATRVAQLWRAQGEEFLERTHSDVEDDVARLRDTAIEEPDAPLDRVHRLAAGVESTVHRLSEWDHAVMESLRTRRGEPGHGRAGRN